jgi:hypothetical protein
LTSDEKPYDLKEIEETAKQYKKFERVGNFISFYGPFLVFIPYVIAFFVGGIFFKVVLQEWEFLFFFFIGIGLIATIAYYLMLNMKKYSLNDQQWAIFYTTSIFNSLSKYFKKGNTDARKKDYRNNAVRTAKEFLARIKKKWVIGSFELVQEEFGDAISQLKSNLQWKIIPNLEHGQDELLSEILTMMHNSSIQVLTLNSIKNFNEQMSKLPTQEIPKSGISYRVSNFFVSHRFVKHGTFSFVILVVSVVFYYAVNTFMGISKDDAFLGAVAIFACFLTIYFATQRK